MTTQTQFPDPRLAATLCQTYRVLAENYRERNISAHTSRAMQTVHGLAHAAVGVFGKRTVVPMPPEVYGPGRGWSDPLAEVRQPVILPSKSRGGARIHDRTVCVVLSASNHVNAVSATVWEENQLWFDLTRQAVYPEKPYYFQDAERGPSLPLMSPERFADYWAASLDAYQHAGRADPFRWVDPETGDPLDFSVAYMFSNDDNEVV